MKHATGDGRFGAFYPDAALSADSMDQYREMTLRLSGTKPKVYEITLVGTVTPGALEPLHTLIKSRFVMDLSKIRSKPRTRDKKEPSGEDSLATRSPYDSYWQPWQGVSRMTAVHPPPETEDAEKAFRHWFGWRFASDIEVFEENEDAFEFDVKLYNDKLSDNKRPNCQRYANSRHWAARTWNPNAFLLRTGKVIGWSTNIPDTADPYFDYADYEDSCSVIDFSFGIGEPHELKPDCTGTSCYDGNDTRLRYNFTIRAHDGTLSTSPFSLRVQRLTNNCRTSGPPNDFPDLKTAPECAALDNDANSRSHDLIERNSTTLPKCVGYYLDFANDPQSPAGTQMYYPVDTWEPWTWRYGEVTDNILEYCGELG